VDNCTGYMNPATSPLDTPFTLSLCSITRNKLVRFFNEDTGNSIVDKAKSCEVTEVRASLNMEDRKLYANCFFVLDSKDEFELVKKDMEIGRLYGFQGMYIQGEGSKKGIRSKYSVKEHYLIVTKYWKIKEDRKFLKKCISLINKPDDLALLWDFENNRNPWSEIETWIYLLSLFYVEMDQSAYNLIVFGSPSSKKTGLLQGIEIIFDIVKLSGTGLRGKVLVPTSTQSGPLRGALLDSIYVTIIDEWFRSFSDDERYMKTLPAIKQGLQRIMEVLGRSLATVGTGMGTQTFTYMNSFIATDNFGYKDELRALNAKDPAILKRFTVMRLSKESEERGIGLFPLSVSEIRTNLARKLKRSRLDFGRYRILANYMRDEMSKTVKMDFKKVRTISHGVVKNLQKIYGNVNYEYNVKLRSFMKSIVVLNAFFRSKTIPTRYIATKSDYELFETIFTRLTEDHFNVYGKDSNVKTADDFKV